MKEIGGTSPFHQFTNPRRDKSVYFWSWGSYLLFMHLKQNSTYRHNLCMNFIDIYEIEALHNLSLSLEYYD